MKNKVNKIAVAFIAFIFLLTGLSTSYALWNEELGVDIDIESGTLKWEFVEPLTVVDFFCPPPYIPDHPYFADWNCDPNYGFYEYEDGMGWGPTQGPNSNYPEPKNVACAELTVVDEQNLKLVVNNAYPGYWNGVATHVLCTGTIPMKIQSVIISYDLEHEDIIAVIGLSNEDQIFDIDLDQDGFVDMELKWGDNFGKQIHQGGQDREISFQFCFLQPLQQSSTFTFYITYRAVQWNEYFDPTDVN